MRNQNRNENTLASGRGTPEISHPEIGEIFVENVLFFKCLYRLYISEYHVYAFEEEAFFCIRKTLI